MEAERLSRQRHGIVRWLGFHISPLHLVDLGSYDSSSDMAKIDRGSLTEG